MSIGAAGGGLLLALWALAVSGLEARVWVILACLAGFVATQTRAVWRGVWPHLAAALSAALVLWLAHAAPGPILAEALVRTGFLAALFAALATLRLAAAQSPMVARVGADLAARPAGQGTSAMLLGAQCFGTFLNFGVIQLLGPLILRGRAPGALSPRDHRQFLGLLQGFAAVLFWSPLTLCFALVSATVAGVHWPITLICGLALAVLALWLAMPSGDLRGTGLARALAPLAGLGLVLVVAVSAVAALQGGAMVGAILITVPAMALAWLALEARAHPRPARWLGRALSGFVTKDLPGQRREIIILCCAAFLGAMAATLVAQTALDAAIGHLPWVLRVILPALATGLIVAAGLAGANPLLAVALVAAPLADPLALGLSPEVVALALMCGWGLSINITPAGASVLMVAQMTGHSARKVGLGWNGGYTLRLYLLIAAGLTLAEAVLGRMP